VATAALFVDLPNFYSHLLRSGLAEPDVLRDYFSHWLDLDRLGEWLTRESSPVWVFYSGRKLGPADHRISGDYLREYVERINSLRGVTAYDVDIEGSQREHATYECEECGHTGQAQWESEKGIDASLTVHLFDTMESWSVAYLLSGDADFVPAVRSLRRRGKTVVGAGFGDRSAALVRECYDYIGLRDSFLKDDVAARGLFGESGLVQRWLTSDISAAHGLQMPQSVNITVAWRTEGQVCRPARAQILSAAETQHSDDPCLTVRLGFKPNIDPSARHNDFHEYEASFPEFAAGIDRDDGHCRLLVSSLGWTGVQRRLDQLASSMEGAVLNEVSPTNGYLVIRYELDEATDTYGPVSVT
jgi:hypothetical protein